MPLVLYLKSITCATDDLIGLGLSDKFIIPDCPRNIPASGIKCAVVKPRFLSSLIFLTLILRLSIERYSGLTFLSQCCLKLLVCFNDSVSSQLSINPA